MLGTVFLLQCGEAIAITLVLAYFYRAYRQNYLKLWAQSWFAYVILLANAVSSVYLYPHFSHHSLLRWGVLLLSLLVGYGQIIWLLFGAYEIATGRLSSVKWLRICLGSGATLAVGTSLMTVIQPEFTDSRFLWPVGVRCLIAGVVLLGGAFLILRHSKKGRIGHRLVGWAFVAFSFYQLFYVAFVLRLLTELPDLRHFSLVNVLIQSLMGLGLVVWMLEEERAKADAAAGALRESEALFRTLAEDSAASIIIHNVKRVLYMNPATEKVTGYTQQELTGQDPFILVHPDHRDAMRQRGIARMRGETLSAHYEMKIMTKSGEARWASNTASLIRFKDESAVLLTSFDITQRRRIEESLRQSEARNRALIEAIPDLMFLHSGDGTTLDVRVSDPLDLVEPPEHLIGKNIKEFLPPTIAEKTLQCFARAAQSGRVEILEYPLMTDGRERYCEARIVATESDKFFRIVRNITERKQAEEAQAQLQRALENSLAEWRLTFDAIETPILMLDGEYRIQRLNQPAKRMLGADFKQLTGHRLDRFAHRQLWKAGLELARQVDQTRKTASCQVCDELQQKHWELSANFFAMPTFGEGVILVARDITTTVELQESLRRNETMVAMGTLVAGVAHEVRNPLFGISATLDAFEAQVEGNSDYTRYTTTLRDEVNRLNRLMKDLLEFGKPHRPNLQLVPIGLVIADAVAACWPLAERRGVYIRNDFCDANAVAWLDYQRIQQVFQNIIENAIQHSPKFGDVAIEGGEFEQASARWIACTVTDAGSGISESDLEHIFQPFFTRRNGGTGLGLAIAQRIVQEHGGEIALRNRPAGGVVAAVKFPLSDEAILTSFEPEIVPVYEEEMVN